MGQRAKTMFAERGIKVISGDPNLVPEILVQKYLAGSLVAGANVCDH
jgi:predicted Fe-Mo cluster-binding NifX family protein